MRIVADACKGELGWEFCVFFAREICAVGGGEGEGAVWAITHHQMDGRGKGLQASSTLSPYWQMTHRASWRGGGAFRPIAREIARFP